jgi:hypothetical protein
MICSFCCRVQDTYRDLATSLEYNTHHAIAMMHSANKSNSRLMVGF